MNWFSLLMAHLVGDYILQNDWMAANKGNPKPKLLMPIGPLLSMDTPTYNWYLGHVACTVHCLVYTLVVWAFSFWWMPWWGLLACFIPHWLLDRFKLARWWMENVAHQKTFAEKMAPWSIIIVDNTFHLLTLWLIGVLAGV